MKKANAIAVLSNKSWRKGGKGGHLRLWHLSSQVTITYAEGLPSRKDLNIYLLMGSSE